MTHLDSADQNDRDDGDIHDHHHERGEQRHDILYAQHDGEKVAVRFVKALGLVLLTHVCLDDARAGYVFLDDGVDVVKSVLYLLEHRLDLAHDQIDDQKLDRKRDRDDDAEFDIQRDRHDDAADEHDRRSEKGAQSLRYEILHHRDVVRHPCDEGTDGEFICLLR